jgi:hypothetical protein
MQTGLAFAARSRKMETCAGRHGGTLTLADASGLRGHCLLRMLEDARHGVGSAGC